MSDIAPILFVSPLRDDKGNDPNQLLREPFYATPIEASRLQGRLTTAAWGNGITVFVVGADRAAVRVGSPERGCVGYTTLEHALAFTSEALRQISAIIAKDQQDQARKDAANGRGR